ncbi:MAG: bifunctional methylenetetrahydrofolate dehydrogenase/methenyltetrahydrofolate cyclohydrolase FolD [Armatimonadetes bacterium]|nr:bifunctional methylenetetrahydrofolate dehydrogenase/methenyltetrahydrofolate cyclohydrolase FolD [Armatimonadota bacterium]CUU35816.1 methylenetetrahydrofolate dehydrogenase (NADP+) / methenyltetrahydrofolate cyclohydrolase [Armatimonadetes bacterium DC]
MREPLPREYAPNTDALLLNGKALAQQIRESLKERVAQLQTRGITPCLAVMLVGDDPASHTYVRTKARACESVGIRSLVRHYPATVSQQELEAQIDAWNADPEVHGVLIQHPVPAPLDESALLRRLDPRKDVDGITPRSLGALLTGEEAFGACTPLGIITLLDAYGIPIEGKHAVVVGRSVILGKPMALMLLNRNATVTICHSRTRPLEHYTRQADILVAALGKPEYITGEMIKPGAVVIDAGYNRVEGRTGDVGDVHFESAAKVASAITPVPGGVGPMTVAMLLQNTVLSAERWASDAS